MRHGIILGATLVALAGAAAAQQSAPRPKEERPATVENTAASDEKDGNVVDSFLDFLKRHAREPEADSDSYWDRHGGGRGGGGGGDSGGGGGH